MQQPHLVSLYLGPYVQRSVVAFEEKGVDYDITYIDLNNKPDWFVKRSPLGKVPVMTVCGKSRFESSVIASHVDEAYAPALDPADPAYLRGRDAWLATAIL